MDFFRTRGEGSSPVALTCTLKLFSQANAWLESILFNFGSSSALKYWKDVWKGVSASISYKLSLCKRRGLINPEAYWGEKSCSIFLKWWVLQVSVMFTMITNVHVDLDTPSILTQSNIILLFTTALVSPDFGSCRSHDSQHCPFGWSRKWLSFLFQKTIWIQPIIKKQKNMPKKRYCAVKLKD